MQARTPMKPPIAVFDLDGTLVHTAPDLVGSLNRALIAHKFEPVAYPVLAPFAGTGGRGMLSQYCLLHDVKLPESRIAALIETFLADYESNIPGSSTIYEGAFELVKSLRLAGFKTAICTNKPQNLANKLLDQLELIRHFDAVCGADYFNFRKPDPKHLTGTIEVAGGDPNRAIMFGDSQTDFDTANAAGIPVIGVTFGYSPIPVETFKLTKRIAHYSEIDVETVSTITAG